MQEVVERVLNVEEEARGRIEAARKRASNIKSNADEKASARVAAARERAIAESKARLESARSEARETIEKTLLADEANNQALAVSAGSKSEAIVADIVAMIIETVAVRT